MRITAKFNGTCGKCGKPTPEGSQIEYKNKKAYHVHCDSPKERQRNELDPLALASSLGFLDHRRAMETDWPLFLLSQRGGNGLQEPDPGRDAAPREQASLFAVPAGKESA